MPRHPPCALKNLTTKDQGVIFERTMKTTRPPHPKRTAARTDPGSYSWKLLLIKDARVHYVVLKQQPRTTHPTHQPPKGTKPCDRCSQETRNTSPTTRNPRRETRPRHGPVASGPNSVPNTKPPRTHPGTVPGHAPEGNRSVLGSRTRTRRPLFVDIPPVSTRRRTIVCATGVLLTTPPHPHTRGKVTVGAP